jgi:thioredoxin reductase (NADPH)
MAKPVLVVVDDEEASREALTRELEARYGAHYRIVSSVSADEALAAPNIDVRYRTEVAGGDGGGRLEQLRLRHRDTGECRTEPADGLFVLIGAEPFTDWLPEAVSRDHWGFILTGPDLAARWTQPREPYLLESSTPGVFAVGDVRHGSVKRVASAVGDGSIAIRLVHEYLA